MSQGNLTSFERYEIKAEAFRILTGHLAPGKDAPSAGNPADYEVRQALWYFWTGSNANIIEALLQAAGCFLKQGGEDANG